MQITIYSTTTCPYCKMLKEYLEGKQITFIEKLVDQDAKAKEEMMAKSGGYLGVPFIAVKKDSGEEATIVGFNKEKLEEIIT